MGGHTLQKAATLLPRNVPRTVRVRPTKQGNGNPTKGALSLSLSIPPWHNAICSTYFRPVAFFRFYPRLFSTPRPHIIHSFQPLAPFLSFSPLSSPHHLSILSTIAAQLRGPLESSKTPAKPLADICSREVLRFIESRTLGSSMITSDQGKKGEYFPAIFSRDFVPYSYSRICAERHLDFLRYFLPAITSIDVQINECLTGVSKNRVY